jgi:hypothetical protein
MDNWKCVACAKNTPQHEELFCFSKYGNNTLKKQDSLKGNWYCEKHFNEKDKELEEQVVKLINNN